MKRNRRLLGDASVNFVRLLADTAAELGATPEPILRKYQLTDTVLGQPKARISIQRYMRIGRELIEASGRPDLGLEMGRRMQITQLGPAGYASMTAGTLEQAIRLWIGYEKLASNNQQGSSRFYRERFRDRSGYEGIAQLYSLQPYNEFNHFVVDSALAGWHSIARWLTGREDCVERVEIEYPAPAHARAFVKLFNCPVQFGQRRNALIFGESALALPSLYRHQNSHLQMLAICEEALTSFATAASTVEKVADLLRSKLPSGQLTLADTAEQLTTTSWSLGRQLKREGSSFSEVLDEVRQNRAALLIKSGGRSLSQISFDLGFASPASFHRARKRWSSADPPESKRVQSSTPSS